MSEQEIKHPRFDNIKTLVEANIPVWLKGPAGSGKNYLCKQIADATNLQFYYTNAVTNEYKITGFIDANGNYHKTQFFEAFTNGGLFFFDELDASIPEILILLNSAIENRYFNFPTGRTDAHPNFRVIAAGNTSGKGADSEYVGRYQLDAASLDRFAEIVLDYDPTIEDHIAEHDKELTAFINAMRIGFEQSGIESIISYRATKHLGIIAHHTKIPLPDAMESVILKGVTEDDREILKGNIPSPERLQNKYLIALNQALNPVNPDQPEEQETQPSDDETVDLPRF